MRIHTHFVLYRQQPLVDVCRRSSSTTATQQWRVESDSSRLFRILFRSTLCLFFFFLYLRFIRKYPLSGLDCAERDVFIL